MLLHLVFSAVVAGVAIALIFYIWYPGVFAEALGGFRLFFLVVGCDVVVGPLLTFVVFNIEKTKRELITDCSAIVLLQIFVLAYGMWVVAESRPVYIVFTKDQLEVVTAIEIDAEDINDLLPEKRQYGKFSWVGPRYVSIQFPTNPKERSQMLMKALEGRDYQFFPKYYRPYEDALPDILERTHPMSAVKVSNEAQKKEIDKAIVESGLNEKDLGWLLVRHRFGFCMALINRATGYPVRYLLIDPEE
jgi:hypothetical protein